MLYFLRSLWYDNHGSILLVAGQESLLPPLKMAHEMRPKCAKRAECGE